MRHCFGILARVFACPAMAQVIDLKAGDTVDCDTLGQSKLKYADTTVLQDNLHYYPKTGDTDA